MPNFLVVVGPSRSGKTRFCEFLLDRVRAPHLVVLDPFDGRQTRPTDLLAAGDVTYVLVGQSVRDMLATLPDFKFGNQSPEHVHEVLEQHHAMTTILTSAHVLELRSP